MHVSLGLTYDYWFPGPQVERALANPESNQPYYTAELRRKFEAETRELFGHRFKDHLSPRVAVSFPVSEQAHVFFNYGHYSQRPPYFYVYSGSGRTTEAYPRKGNPALNPEISVSYEIGGEYQIDGATALRGNLFWKDVFDYPQSTQVDLPSGGSIFLYGNADYGRSQGIELSLHRSRRNFVSGSLAYTFSTAKGKASDPNQTKMLKQAGDDTRDLSLEEEYIAWNRPHKLTASLNLLVRESDAPPRWLGLPWPRDLNGRIFVLLRSGRAYTPYDADGNKIGVRNSRNGPYDSTCDLSLTKGFRLRGRRFLASFDVYNVFDYRTPLIFDWVTGEPYRAGVGSRTNLNQDPANFARAVDARVAAYVREYRRTHENQDPDPALVEEYRKTQAAALSPQYEYSYYYDENPAYFGQPRTFRLGITYEW
jgi:outer membrane receptor protein involved in Fe transport